MKLFIISDIHGSVLAFNKAVEAFDRENASLMVICGDYLNHGPRNPLPEGHDTKGLTAALNSIKSKICGIRGNCDSEVDQMMLDFPVTEASCRIMLLGRSTKKAEAPSGSIFVLHGHLYTRQTAAELTEKGTIIVSGHP
ncbi:MAG: phosphodiesterase, partial [Spirochaetaceae bacterium]|nr:phosphodiesterase [Spirochaetaceae bacterium]